jgi:hypothetical protein
MCSPFHVSLHYMFRPNWSSAGVQDYGVKESAVLLCSCRNIEQSSIFLNFTRLIACSQKEMAVHSPNILA